MTRKRIAGFTGVALATLGFIILISAYATAASKWDDEDCCAGASGCPDGPIFDCTQGSAVCSFNDKVFSDGTCCYSVGSGPDTFLVICGVITLVTVVLTSLILECGDKICCECCQKCTAIIVGINDILGLIFVIIIFVILGATADSTGCDTTTEYKLVGVNGMAIAGTVFLLLGSICACVVTFIECCCDDSPDVGGATTST